MVESTLALCANEVLQDLLFQDSCLEDESSDDEGSSVTAISLAYKILSDTNITQHVRNSGFLQFVVPNFTDDIFRSHFRMTRSTFGCLVSFCEANYSNSAANGGYEPMGVEEMCFITIWYLANQCTMREISVLFDRTVSSVWRAIDRITSVLEKHQDEFIKWPTVEEQPSVADHFYFRAGFPNVIGAIDGTHIEIDAPSIDQKSYLNRKLYHSVILLAVCLPNRAFSYIFAGYPGSVHDARVFRNSGLFTTASTDRSSLFRNETYHVLGDSAFPCLDWLIPAFKQSSANTSQKRKFNRKHSSTRIPIENSFGDLKMIWRRLLYVRAHVSRVVRIIVSCCVLHNLRIRQRDVDLFTEDHVDDLDSDDEPEDDAGGNNGRCGVEKRNGLVQLIGN